MQEELVAAEKHKEISIIQLANKPVYAYKVSKLIMNHKIELENIENINHSLLVSKVP